VDDNDTNMLIMRETLNLWGMRVEEARSADQAVKVMRAALAAGDAFDIVLTDMQMPGKSGLDLLRLMRAEEGLAHTPAVLLTSGNQPDESERAMDKGAFFAAVLDKPVRMETLLWAVTSALNVGQDGDADEEAGDTSPRDEAIPPLSALLVEDVEMNRQVAGRMLVELGHTVAMAANGQEALEAVREGHFDVIFMDVQMPVMDGLQAATAIRELEKSGALKGRRTIIAMTANALKGDRDKCLAAGMDGYLAKPISLDELREVILQALRPKEAKTAEPAGATKPAGAVLDRALLERGFGTNRSFAEDTMKLYLRDVPELMRLVRQAVEEGNAGELAEKSHALKGITGYFTRGEPYTLCRALEEMGRSGELSRHNQPAETAMRRLEECIEVLLLEINHFIAG
jgi:CheY-like chemotaxis protein